jgi:hypothetical protein
MKRRLHSLLVVVLVAVASTAQTAAQDTVQVYVVASGEESGFSSKGTSDSVADLTKALNKKKRLSVVGSKEGADIVVRVQSRDSHLETGGVNTYKDHKGKTQAYTTSKNERAVHATLEVGDFKLPLSGEGTTWTQASDRVAHAIDQWVNENLVRLIEKRKERGQ